MMRPKSLRKLQTYSGIPSSAATCRASAASPTERHPCCRGLGGPPLRGGSLSPHSLTSLIEHFASSSQLSPVGPPPPAPPTLPPLPPRSVGLPDPDPPRSVGPPSGASSGEPSRMKHPMT